MSSLSDLEGPWPGSTFTNVVDSICEINRRGFARHSPWALGGRTLPSREAVATIVSQLRSAFFPWHFGAADVSEVGVAYYVGRTLDGALAELGEQIRRAFLFEAHGPTDAEQEGRRAFDVTRKFAARLVPIRTLLERDVRAAYNGDPAATSPDEVVFSYVGLTAILYHRIAHELLLLGVPLIPRMIAELAHAQTGIDIHPGAKIGGSFFIDHGTGVVIGETCILGERVRLYQGVTLGAKSFPLDAHGNPVKGIPRHPIVEDDVVIYAGATILGRVTIGRGCTIGGNVWLTQSLAPGTSISQAQLRQNLFEGGGGI